MCESININSFIAQTKIGSGNFAKVYKIIEKRTGESFAAKIMKKGYDELSPDERQNFKREIDIMTKLNHPAVIKMMGFSPFNFKRRRFPMIIMEYLPNKSLSTIIDLERSSNSPPSWDSTKKLINMYGIASAISYLHANNIIHRDLKPDNILMDEYLFPRIADFGLSKFKDTNKSQTIKGTPIYTPPEVFSSYNYSFKSDVYAYGLIIYEIVTNQKPFDVNYLTELLPKLVNGERPEIDSTVPECYRNLIERCWSQNPDNRPTFGEIIDLLENDESFIIETVDEDEYFKYVEYAKMDQQKDGGDLLSIPIDDLMAAQPASASSASIIFKKTVISEPVKVVETVPSSKKEEEEEEEEDNFEDFDELLEENNIQSKEEIADFYKKSAQKGNLYAMVKYGEILFNGEGVEQNKEEAVEYFKMASDYENLEGMLQYADALFSGEGVRRNKTKAINLLKKAAYRGNLKAMARYGRCLTEGDGVKQNKEKGVLMYRRAADKGELEAIARYARCLYIGDGCEVDKAKAIVMYQKAADNGDVESMFQYANFLYEGVDVPEDKAEAARYFRMAADLGHIESAFKIAYMLCKGEGVEQQLEESCRYYKMLSDRGIVEGMSKYAAVLLHDVNKVKLLNSYYFTNMDKAEEAVRVLRQAIDLGSYEAMNAYAGLLYAGEVVQQDKAESVNLYRTAAEHGQADAMNNYANLLIEGKDVPMDKELAIQMYRGAADKGHTYAAYNYALFLEEIGSPRDEIIKYMKIAADKGHHFAQWRYAQHLLEENNNIEANRYMKMVATSENDELIYLLGKRICMGEIKDTDESKGYALIGLSEDPKSAVLRIMLRYSKSCNIC